jgi:predicted metal-dependent enzyme (double-stranded beta helix superfamily)
MFDVQKFVGECKDSLNDSNPAAKVKDLVLEAISDPAGVQDAFARAENVERQGPITFASRDITLSVADVTTPSGLRSPAHNHKMWAVIGVYAGQEHNKFYRYQDGVLCESGERLLEKGDVVVLDTEAIHAISNPLQTNSSAIHVYGGDLVDRPERSMWNPHTLEREDYDIAQLLEYVKEISGSP